MTVNRIRKKLSLLMTFIMILSIFPTTSMGAITPKVDGKPGLKRATKAISKDLKLYELVNGRFDTGFTGVEIDITDNGKYNLEYYITNNKVPTKVEMQFDVDTEEITVESKVFETIDLINPKPTPKAYRIKDVANDTWPTTVTTTSSITTKLNRKQAPYTDKGKIIGIKGETLEIRYTIDPNNPNKLLLTTNGIEKGNITKFNLKYKDTPKSRIEILEEFAKFAVNPVHLLDNAGTIKENIDPIKAPDKAGSKPGMKIEFEQPREIDEANLTFIPMINGNAVNIQLNLKDYIGSDIQLNTTLNPGETDITIAATSEKGIKKYNSGTNLHTIYIVKEEETGTAKETIKWDKLDQSRMMETVELVIPETGNTRLKNLKFQVEEKGHTYLGFWIERTSETEAVIKYIPYQGLGNTEMLYTVYQDGTEIAVANGTQSNTIPIPFLKEGTQEYRIEIKGFGEQIIKSQTLTYDAFKDNNIPPPTPQIQNITNIYAIPSLDKNKQPQSIGFDLEWSAPKSATTGGAIDVLLKDGDLYYEMFLYEDAKTPLAGRVYSKVFKVSKNTAGDITVSPHGGKAGKNGATEEDEILRYNVDKDTFTMEKIELKGVGSESKWNQLDGFPIDYDNISGYPQVIKEVATLPFKSPNTYYVTIRAVYDKTGATNVDKKLTTSRESNPVPISIGETREVIPGVNQIVSENNTKDTTNISQSIIFEQSDLKRYYDRMLEPAGWYLWKDSTKQEIEKYLRTYEIFLYQQNEYKEEYTESDFVFEDKGDTFIAYDPLDPTKDSIDLTSSQKNDLRNGKVIPIKYVGLENSDYIDKPIVINNLDPNQVYYIQMKVRVDAQRETIEPKTYTDYSLLSKIHSFTTYTKPLPPTPDEQVPPAPKEFWVEEKQPLDDTIATLGWLAPDYVLQDGNTMHYEIVKATDNRLKESELLRELSVEEILKSNKTAVGFRTKLDFIETINTTTGSWIQLKPEQSSAKLKLKDVNLTPNTTYYYYIRTIVTLKGQEVSSEWIMIPVTTKPVNKPSKLKIEHPDDYKYDTKNEVVISFLAPIPKGSKIPEEYDFDIAVKGEKDEDYKLNYKASRITSKEDEKLIPTGYMHFVYKIEGLKPGSRYDIKVRIIDKTKGKPTAGDYPKSLYSDKVMHRTEYDEEEADKDNKYEEYLKKYDSEAEKLRRKSYWEVDAGKYERQYKYRKDYIEAELGISNMYELVTAEDAQVLYYYFPASMIETVNKLGSMMQVKANDTSITLRPYTLSSKTQEIEDAIKKIKNSKLKDYYIALEVRTSDTSEKINGQVPVSPRILVDMELIELDEEDIFIEENIMDRLNKLIDRGRERVITALEKELDKGAIKEERLDSIINKEIEDIKENHKEEVKDILKRQIDDTESIGKIDKSILITSKTSSYNVNGYYQKGGWNPVYAFATAGGYAMEAEELGNYVFVSGSSSNPIAPDIPGAQGLVGKYNLTDFFDVDTRGLAAAATKADVYGSLARMLGAKRNVDYMDYLQARGIQGVSKANINQPIRQDEAIYLIMQGYEKIYFKSVNAIQIKNRQSVQNIGAFQPYHRPYIYAAVEIGVVAPVNNKVIPSQTMTAKDIINMLSKIVPK